MLNVSARIFSYHLADDEEERKNLGSRFQTHAFVIFPFRFCNPSDCGYIFQPKYVADIFAKQILVFRLLMVKFSLEQSTKAQGGGGGE